MSNFQNKKSKISYDFIYQVMSAGFPAIIMLLTIPLIRNELNIDKFSAFTFLLTTAGLLSALDGGLSRASTYFISSSLKPGCNHRTNSIFHGVIIVGIFFSIGITIICAIATIVTDGDVISISRDSLLILVFFIPVFIISSLVKGYLEAERNFYKSSILQLVYASSIGIAPAIIFYFTNNLSFFAWTICITRTIYLFALLKSCKLLNIKHWKPNNSLKINTIRVFNYAKWLFLSNIIGLAIVFSDRFIVAALFTATTVASYILPMEIISRGQILTNAFCTVFFPRITNKQIDQFSRIKILNNAQGLILSITSMIVILLDKISNDLMIWLIGSNESSLVFIFGASGLGIISCGAIAMLELNSRGITKPIAILHTIEIVPYILALLYSAKESSITLLLSTWTLRLIFDSIFITYIAKKTITDKINIKNYKQKPKKLPWYLIILSVISIYFYIFLKKIMTVSLQDLCFTISIILSSSSAYIFFTRIQKLYLTPDSHKIFLK